MMWEQLENCPPGPVADFRKDPRYERCIQANGRYLFHFEILTESINLRVNWSC